MDKWMVAAGAVALACIAGEAGAQTQEPGGALQPLLRCRSIAAAEARLACYDREAAATEAAIQAKDVTVLDRKGVREVRRSLFGFTLPRLPLFGGDDAKPEEFEEINTTIASARPVANGRIELRLADNPDAVWVTTDPMPFPPRTGKKIRIRKGALGNYFIAIEGERSVRGIRTR